MRERREIERLLRYAYQDDLSADRLMRGLATVAAALNANDPCLARIAAVHLRIPDLPNKPARDGLEAEDNFIKCARDEGGGRGWISALHRRTGTPATGETLEVDSTHIDAVEKLYNPEEPRVPAGSGRTSGQWTRGFSLLGDLTATAAESPAEFALGLGGAAAVFGLLFIPSSNDLSVEGEVEGVPGLRYAWNCDESLLRLTYDSADGSQRTFTAQLEDDFFRDDDGRTVGRILPDGTVAIDPAAISADLVDEDEPKLCPAPGPDKPGGSEQGRDYEDYVKSVVNPDNQTLRGWGFQLPNPENSGALVYYDDCEHSTGTLSRCQRGIRRGVSDFPQKPVFELSPNSFALVRTARSTARRCTPGPIRWYFCRTATAAFARSYLYYANEGRNRPLRSRSFPGRGENNEREIFRLFHPFRSCRARPESPGSLGAKFPETLDALTRIDPTIFANWKITDLPREPCHCRWRGAVKDCRPD